MLTSKEVFAKRKEGKVFEAYEMAKELLHQNPNDEWNIRAYAYCVIDMVKYYANENNFLEAQKYIAELDKIPIDANDEILTKSVDSARNLADANKKIIREAKALSKAGRHNEAIMAYRTAIRQFPDDMSLHESLGWELYRIGKNLIQEESKDIYQAKQLLAEYIRLRNERPSLLHSLFLRLADKLIGHENFNLIAFLRLWNLDNLMMDDYEAYEAENGNRYPSIAEKVIQHAAKEALQRNNIEDVTYILPYVDHAIVRFPENFWLIYYKAKLLHLAGRDNEAVDFSIAVTKTKVNEYWSWSLLAEVLWKKDREKAFSCYCKALLCGGEEKFLANIRIKLAQLLIERSMFPEAKYEIDKAIESREKAGWKLTEELLEFQNTEWYQKSVSIESNERLYKENVSLAESLLFANLPWKKAIVGSVFINKSKKKRRKLYIEDDLNTLPLEVSVPETLFEFDTLDEGEGISVKYEEDNDGRANVFVVERRDIGQKWDIFIKQIGVVDHVNIKKGVVHFIVDKMIDGIIHINDYSIEFVPGMALELLLSRYKTKTGVRHNVIMCQQTDDVPNSSIIKAFSGMVRVSNGLGFTDDDIFLDPIIVHESNIEDGDFVSGIAVINYDKKKGRWGWKAVDIEP